MCAPLAVAATFVVFRTYVAWRGGDAVAFGAQGYDFLHVYSSELERPAELLASLSGTTPPRAPIVSRTGTLVLVLVTDFSVEAAGFHATYAAAPPLPVALSPPAAEMGGSSPPPSPSAVDTAGAAAAAGSARPAAAESSAPEPALCAGSVRLTQSTGTVSSGFASPYTDNMLCTWVVDAQERVRPHFRYTAAELPATRCTLARSLAHSLTHSLTHSLAPSRRPSISNPFAWSRARNVPGRPRPRHPLSQCCSVPLSVASMWRRRGLRRDTSRAPSC